MIEHMREVPVANRSPKGPGDRPEAARDTTPAKHPSDVHSAEQGDTANVKQNTTNKGFFAGRRTK